MDITEKMNKMGFQSNPIEKVCLDADENELKKIDLTKPDTIDEQNKVEEDSEENFDWSTCKSTIWNYDLVLYQEFDLGFLTDFENATVEGNPKFTNTKMSDRGETPTGTFNLIYKKDENSEPIISDDIDIETLENFPLTKELLVEKFELSEDIEIKIY